MSIFGEAELAFLREARLARLATIGPDGAPQVRPVGFVVDAEAGTLDIAGMRNPATQKWRNIQRDPRVALVVDDVLPPWRLRALEIRGEAEVLPDGQPVGAFEGAPPGVIRIRPRRILAYGIEDGARPHARSRADTRRPLPQCWRGRRGEAAENLVNRVLKPEVPGPIQAGLDILLVTGESSYATVAARKPVSRTARCSGSTHGRDRARRVPAAAAAHAVVPAACADHRTCNDHWHYLLSAERRRLFLQCPVCWNRRWHDTELGEDDRPDVAEMVA